MGRKIVKNQELTPLLFVHIFRPKIFNVTSPKNHSNHCKTSFYAIKFHILTLFRMLEMDRKIVKNQRLTLLVFGQSFPHKIFNVILWKNHSNNCRTSFYAINFHILTLFRKLEMGRKIVENQRLTPLHFG